MPFSCIEFCVRILTRLPLGNFIFCCIHFLRIFYSGGMNGFLWLSERNVLTNVIPSPIHGLEDIVNNQVYNVTYLNPAKHKHIPRPPAGVVIPPKVLGPLDTKPFPVLWHEDNSGRRQNGRERPSVPGAMVGPMLGEAAHRLVKSTLNIKLNNNQSSGILEPPRNRNFLGYYAVNRPRPAAPSGYERGFSEDTHQYHGNHNYTII
ncbi:5'-3' exoribonuclease 4-like isoform X1 [Syzygium oleosum]|uniref:5'-3' exoribonuclease 4-like isoform X1 n=2 Tax=Syzygium oleosum TaxID=219896 RepID=UPI0024BA7D96|nr:5'-3' exoribonuclease 4-like isoform X1 [Syzygium oleosum]XP_056172525.1 5'-3' exoribonuclease 4-like isoform X1 [Syzygium oleosum]XP_056172526.1 5'-3' exoribonuclease 4-like isoform X1 [Syzygium oleosum]XP_056172527.1 5'-3' exoribonuclease 4-like isoform X1 [Syzygium oleosum]XP_056172528.1 5'-3' exoribonuclease 4-like isoform X1 [Syzygium oleosum]XP_056172529.1 5'-3' exoribonuclease 4-like isoform X1 [Syzygium oleosum]XP_056172530.1 5'-3' exoribonuclease 4-like isoform X1 [Syzygium oleosu